MERIDWAHELREFISTFRSTFGNSWRKLKEYGPSTQILFWLLVVSLLWFSSSILSMPLEITGLAYAILIYAFLALPALLALLLLLRRRPFGLYGVLGVFVFWFLSTAGLLNLLHEHENSSVLLLWTIIAFMSGWGSLAAFREAAGGNVLMRILAFVSFFSLELGTVWVFFYFASS